MYGKTCFFIGHREAPYDLLPALQEAVERHITEYGVRDFVVGQYGRFDALAETTLVAAKRRHSEVRTSLLLPYHPIDRPVPVPEGFDDTYYPPGMESAPKRLAIVRANRYMVEHCTHLIAYVCHPASNARNLLDYARGRVRRGELRVENLADTR